MDDLTERFASLQIQVLSSDEGFTVISDAEPAFCFVRQTLDQVAEVVSQALTSYAKTFYDAKVTVACVVEEIEPVRTVTLRRNGRVQPRLVSGDHSNNHAYA